ncbi:hypothetical protein GDO86_015480 [Hymenochirus boettgeri]|uniref:SKI/SNO/DAC domain-containing protein n=1 Tax=Hymenochirus boettgeri TaxID=247094 RepID=A0A8T2JYG0_9PIPI|nr:hypothetical protein GDO86_015480 [Hymenochirus boettgeri]
MVVVVGVMVGVVMVVGLMMRVVGVMSPRLGILSSFIPSGSSPLTGGSSSECRMVDLHGAKVASFVLEGQELICLPQVFDLFLKHLVGGLHTVYTKLKRLDITPVVCTVEQVRVLRGLGAIQPGVNRCKLITRRDFETLYNDCTNARRECPCLLQLELVSLCTRKIIHWRDVRSAHCQRIFE